MRGHTQQLSLAWSGLSPAAAQSSYEAAVSAEAHALADCETLRRFYRTRGYHGSTDAETELALGWPPNIVTARRGDLIQAGDVVTRYPESRRQSVKTPKLEVTIWVLSSECR